MSVSSACSVREVLRHLFGTDVLEHADRRDGVEALPAQIPVVLHPDLDLFFEPGLLDPQPGQVGLRAAEGHADDRCAVAAGGVQGHGAPPAADVEQARAGSLVQSELATHEVVLGLLRRLERGGVVDEAGARVRHARTEHQAVELVADVVVMADHLGVACLEWRLPCGAASTAGRAGGRPRTPNRVAALQGDQRHAGSRLEVRRGRLVQGAEHTDHVTFGLELAGDIGPAQAQFAGCPQHALDRGGRTDDDRPRSVARPERTAVPELEADGQPAA